jgi:CRISPR-associated protein Csb2
MPSLTIGWDFLTGKYVATDVASRERAEWPPHPGRVFMALAAAWFETGREADEGAALKWLEKLGDPELVTPRSVDVSFREVVTVFVPVNDTAGPSKAVVPSAPSLTRSRQPRAFPSVWVGDRPCYLRWQSATGLDTHRPALDRICTKVTRIGHSSSLVRLWLEESQGMLGRSDVWVPEDVLPELQSRRVSEGTLDWLERQFNQQGRDEYERLNRDIEGLSLRKRAIRGRGASEQKAAIDAQVDACRERLKSVDPRLPIRPVLGLWSGYRRRKPPETDFTRQTQFDTDVLVLTRTDGPRLPLVSTMAVTRALRSAVMSHSGLQPPPAWVSGHDDDSQPLRDGLQHLAFVPLPFVGSEHADGHLLGVALVFPRAVPRADRGEVLRNLLLAQTREPKPITLTLGSLGVWTLVQRDWAEPRRMLTAETWTASPGGAKTWATVTPAVLDRFPKADRVRDRSAWENEVAVIIATACERIGLPEPVEVQFGTTSWHRGSPRAVAKRRPLRGQPVGNGGDTSTLGDGFPPFPAKGSAGPRPQLHIYLRFDVPIVGPVLLCAGRFLGYGFCKPL